MDIHSTFATRTIFNIGWRYLLRHPWQTTLMILGITLGVAVVVAIDLANASARLAFDLSTDAVAGRATHQIVGGPNGLDESVYIALIRSGVVEYAAPVISEYISAPSLDGGIIQLMGVDPFAETPFRNYLGGESGTQVRQPVGNLIKFFTQPGAILISEDMARRSGLRNCPENNIGCSVQLEIDGIAKSAIITGYLEPTDSLSRRALDTLVLTDIASAQELTGKIGSLDRIDLIISEPRKTYTEAAISKLLPASARLIPVEARTGTIEEMTSAFRVNLTALSLLALVVGLFLIYNTITFSVVQRRPLFGTLRSLGVTRREVFALVVSEALAVGLIGGLVGIILGVIMGQAAVGLVTQTINDLFFVLTVRGVQIPTMSLIKGGLLGVAATLLSAAPPAWEAASVPPNVALSRSGLEKKAQKAVCLAGLAGLVLIILGIGALLIPSRNLILSFSATFSVIIGFALEAPIVTSLLMKISAPPLGSIWGSLGRMAPRDVINSLSRTSVAVAALMVAVSVTIGVSLMVSSFRYTVVNWLEQTLQGDIYISAPSLTSTQTTAPLDSQVLSILDDLTDVDQVYTLRSVDVDSPLGLVHIAATDNSNLSEERGFLSTSIPIDLIASEMKSGAVIISEPFANRMGIREPSGEISLYTDNGSASFPVVGIYYDYSSTQGTVLMTLDVYRQNWEDNSITAAALKLQPGVNVDQTASEIKAALVDHQQVLVRANQALRNEVLQVFDRTFTITGALQLLATIVAFIGVLSALLSVELERQRELGILRAVGLTARQLWGLIMLETGLLGTVAGLLAMPTGYILAVILIFIINRRSFGWTLQMQLQVEPFVIALVVAVSAAMLAGVYPARRMSRMMAADALRYE
jgi:putative ABC transport system permease protein